MKQPVKPPSIVGIEQNWRPSSETEKTHSLFWQIFTGHLGVFGEKSVEDFIDALLGKSNLPSSEIKFLNHIQPGKSDLQEIQEIFQEILHQSWIGIQGDLRIYVFDNEGFAELKEKLTSNNIPL